jgi:hypothetical protein
MRRIERTQAFKRDYRRVIAAPKHRDVEQVLPAVLWTVGLLCLCPAWTVAAEAGPCMATAHGCVAFNPDVSQQTLGATICRPGYTRWVRPAPALAYRLKLLLMRRAGIDPGRARDFELDHIIPLALGGHPRQLSNLQLQDWDSAWAKDRLERRLHDAVCRGAMSLAAAQSCIAEDWRACAAARPGRGR